MRELSGKTAVVTGAGSGIGRAIAIGAAEHGMRIVVADIDGRAAEAVRAELERRGAEALAVAVDVAVQDQVDALSHATYERFGKAHLVVNNAGIALGALAWDTSLADYERVLRVNLYGVIHGVRAFLPKMLASGEESHVVNVASAAGLFTVPGFAAYSASKFAVVGFTEALHHDLVLRGAKISTSLLCPSWVQTNLTAGTLGGAIVDPETSQLREKVKAAVADGIPPSEVAQAVFTAVLTSQFYVLTHETTRAAVARRAEDIIQARSPSLFLR